MYENLRTASTDQTIQRDCLVHWGKPEQAPHWSNCVPRNVYIYLSMFVYIYIYIYIYIYL